MTYGGNAFETNAYNSGERSGIAVNSLVAVQGSFLKNNAGFIDVAGAGDDIVGVSTTLKTFSSDNSTVGKEEVNFKPEPNSNNTYKMTITGGSIAQADEHKYYDIDSSMNINGASKSTTTGQMQMVKFISATVGIFKVVNLPADPIT